MTTASISLQDLRRSIYIKAKTEPTWRFWGLYVHVCKRETLYAAYEMAKRNHGAPGIDDVTFAAIEQAGVEPFLAQIQDELRTGCYRPLPNRTQAIPKGGGQSRLLGIPAIRDRVVQGALKLILEPVFEADFQDGSYGYRPGKTAHQAIQRVQLAALHKAQVIDVDLQSYFDTIRHDRLLAKVAQRINDDRVLHLLKLILKASGKRGLAQGGVISPLLSNLYLNEVDQMLEKAKEVTRQGNYTRLEYARYADDLVILVYGYPWWEWLLKGVFKRLQEELAHLDVQLNLEKTRIIDLAAGERFAFLGFDFRLGQTRTGRKIVWVSPRLKARTALLAKLRALFRRYRSQPTQRLIQQLNPVLRGWINYFRIGNASRCFNYVRDWVERMLRRHLNKARGRSGFGWNTWSRAWLYQRLGLYGDYQIRYD